MNWLNTTVVVIIPIFGFLSAFWTPLHLYTAIFAVAYYLNSGICITAGQFISISRYPFDLQILTPRQGYHRLWAHSSYRAAFPLRLYLAFFGAGAFENSIRRWVRDHRAHHRYTDTEKDPYTVHKGFFHAHIGWLIFKRNPKNIGRVDISDLDTDPLVIWQHKNYPAVAILATFIIPTFICGLWGDWPGGLVYAGIIRLWFVQQATFCVNSLAHWLGEQPYSSSNSPTDHFFTALVTLGEGYHNFHHEYPSDYRNTVKWWHYDPTKWMIKIWQYLGLAFHLQQFSSNEIEKARFQQLEKQLERKRKLIDWGTPVELLPVISWDDFKARSKNVDLIIIAGFIYDVSNFKKKHPGGWILIDSATGTDATALFNGGVYQHSNAARNLLLTMRVGILSGGCKVEIRKEKN